MRARFDAGRRSWPSRKALSDSPRSLIDSASAPTPALEHVPLDGPAGLGAQAHDAVFDSVAAGMVHAEVVPRCREGLEAVVAALLPELAP